MKNFNTWLISIGTAVLLAFAGWVGTSIVEHSAKPAAVEASESFLANWLERIEKKLDRVLRKGEQK